jgi:signal transduction histidine kinase
MEPNDNLIKKTGFCLSEEKLKELSVILGKVKRGDFSIRMESTGNGEADIIVSNINFLVSSLEKAQKTRESEVHKIREKNEELEKVKMALTNILEDAEKAKEKAEEEKNKTLSIISNLSDGLMVFDGDQKVSIVNTQAESFFGVKEKELYGKKFSNFPIFPVLFR